jgi:lysophospholipase L1-like esterase
LADTLLYGTILVLPLLFAVLLYWFARRLPTRRPSGGEEHAVRWLRLLIGNLLVFLLASSALLAGFETYYRFFYDSTDSFGLTRTTERWFERHYQFNANAVRDNVDYAAKRTPGRVRITFLGDSFTAGHGIANVDDRFANLVRAARPAWEIHALARNGLDTGGEIDMLQIAVRDGCELDRVVLVYCLNDIADIVPEWQAILDRIYERGRTPGFLVRNSYAADILYYRLKALRDPDVSHYYQFVRKAYDGPLWEVQKRRLGQLADFVGANGGKLLVVTFPFLHALGPRYEYQGVHEKLDALWQSLGVPRLDLLGVYAGFPSRKLTINGFDAHPNELAHRLAAKAIVEFLDQQTTQDGGR